jgi:hypothetical protein
MKRKILGYAGFIILLFSFILAAPFSLIQSALASAPEVEWTKTYAGATGSSVIKTSDQGYLIVSSPQISTSDTLLELIKTDSTGNQVWLKTYQGFPGNVQVIQATDGGYALAGVLSISNKDNLFLAKLDFAGAPIWNFTFSYDDRNNVSHLIQTSDGGYAMLGYTVNYATEQFKCLLVKVDNSGNFVWNQTFGDSRSYSAFGFSQTNDGGYAIGVTTQYFGYSLWLIKTDSLGSVQWFRPFQGNMVESQFTQIYGNAALATNDGGYFLLSQISWYQANVSTYVSAGLAIKTDANGDQQWNKTLQNTYSNVVQTLDGGYVLGKGGGNSIILSKIDGLGNIQWNGSYPSTTDYYGNFFAIASDGGVVLTGTSQNRALLTKIAPTDPAPFIQLPQAIPHGVANATIIKQTFVSGLYSKSIIQTLDGGYAAVGQISNNDFEASAILLKTDASLNVMWSKPISFGTDTYMSVVVQTKDGGYAVAGQKKINFPGGPSQFCMEKFSSTGQSLWSQTYTTTSQYSYGDYLRDFIQTNEGDFVLAGITEYASGFIDALHIVKADSIGNLVWNKTVLAADGTRLGTTVSSIVQTDDRGFSVIGTDDSYGSSLPSYFKIIHFDADGNVLWAKTYGDQNGDANSFAYDGILTSDGGYLVVGTYYPSASLPHHVLMVKTNSQGSLSWYKIFDEWPLYTVGAVCQTLDGGYVFSSATDRFPCIVKVSPMGDIEGIVTLESIFENVYTIDLPAVIVSSDNNLATSGRFTGLNNTIYNNIWLSKIAMFTNNSAPTPTPPSTSTPTPTTIETPTPSPTAKPSPSITPTQEPAPTSTQTPAPTVQPTEIQTPTPSPTIPEFTQTFTTILVILITMFAATIATIKRTKKDIKQR